MKNNIVKIIIVCLLISEIFSSCEKDKDILAFGNTTEGLAFLKLLHYAPSFRAVTLGRDSFNVYVNGIKVNGSFITYNTIFPGTANPYFGVPAGPQSIRITVNGTLTPDSITLATFSKNLEAGGYYSFIITDSLLKSNESKQIFLKDNFAFTDTGKFTLRLVHAVLNDTLGKNVDIFSTLYNTNIFSNIAPGTATDFIPLQYTTAADVLIVRRAGTLFELARLASASFSRRRAYTIVYKGQPGTTSGTKARSLIQYTNL